MQNVLFSPSSYLSLLQSVNTALKCIQRNIVTFFHGYQNSVFLFNLLMQVVAAVSSVSLCVKWCTLFLFSIQAWCLGYSKCHSPAFLSWCNFLPKLTFPKCLKYCPCGLCLVSVSRA